MVQALSYLASNTKLGTTSDSVNIVASGNSFVITDGTHSSSIPAGTDVGSGGATVYATVDDLPGSATTGEQAFVSATNRLYLWNGSGWYNIALINTDPTIDANNRPESDYTLDSDTGSTTTVTLFAEDPEGLSVTYSAVPDADFSNLATISQSANVFTITPADEANANTTSGTVTFRASDGINFASTLSTFRLVFTAPRYTGYNALLLKADNTAPTAPTDGSTNNLSITTVGTQTEAFSGHHPFGLGSSYYFNGSSGTGSSRVVPANNTYDIGTDDFTLEGWVYNSNDGGVIISNRYWEGGNNRGWMVSLLGTRIFLSASQGSWNVFPEIVNLGDGSAPLYKWTHFSFNRVSGVIYSYINGTLYKTTNYSASLNQTGGSSGNRYSAIGNNYADNSWQAGLQCYMRDILVNVGSAIRTADFTPPSEMTGVDDQLTLTTDCKFYGLKGDNTAWDKDFGPNSISHTFYNLTTGSSEAPKSGDYQNWTSSTKGGSYYFDGTTSPYFKVDADSALGLGTGDFTIEFWFKPKSLGKTHTMIDARTTDSQAAIWLGINTANYLYLYISGSTRIQSNAYIRNNVWYHMMITRSSSVTRMFINGHYEGQWADTTNYISSPWFIGQRYTSRTTSNASHGYMKDLRVRSVASATTNDNITVPTEKLTAVSNTLLLVAGDTTGKIFDVAAGLNDIRADMIQGDASASTTQTKNASVSMYFDGAGDYLSVPDGTNLDFSNSVAGGAASYTLETWVYPTTVAGSTWRTICNNGTSGNYAPMYLTISGDKLHYLASHDETSYVLDTRTDFGSGGIHTMSANTWQHVAVTWNEGRYNFFVDGNHKGSFSKSGYPMDPNYDLGVGARDDGNEPFSGYLEDFRITKHLSRYPFIPARETLSNDSNTVILACHASSTTTAVSGAGATVSNLTAYGDPTSHPGPYKDMSAVDFDGSGDVLVISNPNTDLGGITGAFTIEGWVKWDTAPPGTGAGNERQIVGQHAWPDGSSDWWALLGVSTGLYWYAAEGGSYTLTQFPTWTWDTTRWYHIALTRDSSDVVSLFLNGNYMEATSNGTNGKGILGSDGRAFSIGADNDGSHTPMDGKISNLRISNTVRYTKNFTPPTGELTG